MKKAFLIIFFITLSLLNADEMDKISAIERAYKVKIKDNFIIFENNKTLEYNLSKITQTLDQIYPNLKPLNSEFIDAGRLRSDEFLKQIYGENEDEVRKNLIKVHYPFANEKYLSEKEKNAIKDSEINQNYILFNSKNNAANALKRVFDELELLAKNDKQIAKSLAYHAGSFKWRVIAKTHDLSSHSFGIALDIVPFRASYWQWGEYQNPFKEAVILAFERQGFIWGGRWSHHDTMHFEYRPEFMIFNKMKFGNP